MRTHALLVTIMALALSLCPLALRAETGRDTLFQLATIDALLAGLYDPVADCGLLKAHGDTGLGTFSGLDGEMVVDKGVVYKVGADGAVAAVSDAEGAPFAAVTWFEADSVAVLPTVAGLDGLKSALDAHLPGSNRFYAIRAEGAFDLVVTRSVPKQAPPYPPLTEVVKAQSVFRREAVRGVLVGLYCPPFVAGLNVPGYHFHFLSADKDFGGHVLDMRARELAVGLDATDTLALVLPGGEAFQALTFGVEKDPELERVERQPAAR